MKKVFIVGASSDLAEELIPGLLSDGNQLLLHCGKHIEKITDYSGDLRVSIIAKQIKTENDCKELIRNCKDWNDSIDGLVILIGGMAHPVDWTELSAADYARDYTINTIYPVLIATGLCDSMKNNGGRIVLISTASASHGGGRNSLSYGMAKAAIECATKRLAKDLAQYDILVNAISPGYMDTSIHIKAKGISANENYNRLATIPLGRAGTKKEFAGLVRYLLSEDASFITGQIIALDGGDFV